MSYINTINSTRTPEHHIGSINPSTNGKYLNAQGGITGQALKTVANFIGMDDIEQKPITPGYLSIDLELEQSARHRAFNETASLESEELKRRTDSYYASLTGKVFAHHIADIILAWNNSGEKLRESQDRVETRKFIKSVHDNMNEIERFERDRRLEDHIGENFKQGLAAELCAAISTEIMTPQLRPVTLVASGSISRTLNRATEIASGAAGSIFGSMYQIGHFAARAAYFFGGKAVAKAQVLEQKAVANTPALYEDTVKIVAHAGEQVVSVAQVLGEQAAQTSEEAIHKGADLKLKAGALVQTWINSAEKLATSAQDAIAAGQDKLDALFEPATLSWQQLSSLEDAERTYRVTEGISVSRFLLALTTSSLVFSHLSSTDAGNNRYYGTVILEEMERSRRIAQDKISPSARLNAKRAAGAIMTYRRQTLCKQNAQIKAQERFEHVKIASPQHARNMVQFATPVAQVAPAQLYTHSHTQAKRMVPQVASKRYDYVRESSHDNLILSQQHQGRAAM